MGMFNHLFGSKSDLAREIQFDAVRRMTFWQEHLDNFPEREELAKFFSFNNVDNAIAHPQELDKVLARMESLISRDLITIGDEEKTEEEITKDIERIFPGSSEDPIDLVSIVQKRNSMFKTLRRLHDILMVELHAMRTIRKTIREGGILNRDFLLKIFRLIFHDEANINNNFIAEDSQEDMATLDELNRLTRFVILEEKVTEDMQTAEEAFVRMAVPHMADGSKHKFRRLAESIYEDLLEMVGAPFRDADDIEEGVKQLELKIQDDKLLRELIIKNRRKQKFTDEEILWMVKAFQKAFEHGHFEELNAGFGT